MVECHARRCVQRSGRRSYGCHPARRDFAATYPSLPLYRAICTAAAEDVEVAALLLTARPGQDRPVLLLAALHDLVLRLVEDSPADPPPVTRWFASLADPPAILRDDVAAVRDTVLSTAQRRTGNLLTLAELCATEPAFTAQMVTDRGVSLSSAYRLLDRLVAAGLIRPEKPIHGVTVWTVPGLTEALDRFAARAGRRTFRKS